MGSLRGDVMVVRNGRSTSEISVYNYPEHLNPFYDDEQHKRLRFWKLGKKDGADGKRNSFSISNLRDMWTFKSLRSKKKSSTLGINKTSESPPSLRRDLYIASAQPADNFQRNGFYRSSLQNIPISKDEFGFAARQGNYRRTMQGGFAANQSTLPSRYGSLTPQAMHRNHGGLSNGSSQLSVASTNPFDTDDDECNDDVDTQRRTSVSSKGVQKTPRKKRRAPLPPAFVQQSTSTEDSGRASEASANEQDLNISSLSAEIQSFVESSTKEKESVPSDKPKGVEQPSPSEVRVKVETTEKKVTVVKTPSTPTAKPREETLQIEEDNTEQLREIERSLESEHLKITEQEKTIQNVIANASSNTESPPVQEQDKVHIIKTTEKFLILEKTQPLPPSKSDRHREAKESRTTVSETSTSIASDTKLSNITEKSQPSVTELGLGSPRQPEVGRLECIHVHLNNNPAAGKRQTDELSSFRPETPKSILKSPKMVNKRGNDVEVKEVPSDDLRINEEPCHPLPKPAIRAKPQILVQKKFLPDTNSSEFSTIHKPHRHMHSAELEQAPPASPLMRRKQFTVVDVNQNTEVVTASQPEGSLKIVESKENILKEESSSKDTQQVLRVEPKPEEPVDRFLYRRFTAPAPAAQSNTFEWKQSTLAPLEPVPPEKRKSVKDIIESINRSQRLLNAAAHKGEPNDAVTSNSNDHQYLDSQQIVESQNARQETEEAGAVGENNKEFPEAQHKDPLKIDNSEILRKFEIHKEVFDFRESSPTSSNLDWNPVPKPKRTKNITD